MNWKAFVTALIVIPVVDYIWLGLVASSFYINQLGDMARLEDGAIKPVLWAAGVVYVLLAVGVTTLVLPQTTAETPIWKVFALGALFGLVVYGVYDFTNHSTLARYPAQLAFADVAWGTVVCGLGTLAAWFASVRSIS